VTAGSDVSGLYDPMFAKLVVWDEDRELAIRRMARALDEYEIGGITTLLPLHRAVMRHPEFAAGGTMREYVEGGGFAREYSGSDPVYSQPESNGLAPVTEVRRHVAEVDGKRFEVRVQVPEHAGRARLRARREALAARAAAGHGVTDVVKSPMQGTVLRVGVAAGDEVAAGQVLVVIEAMKMENEIVAHHAGAVEAVDVAEGDSVTSGQALVRLQ
jgi:acetyl-CoA/propionyl-CoA carboxylase biotin carboxyl carrier protein